MFGSANNKTLFGSSNQTSAFGQPNTSAFGVQSAASSTPFGAMSGQQQQQSMFGASNALNTFGTSGNTSTLFGSTQPSLFGSTAANTTNTSFAPTNSNSFGTSSGSLFGAPQNSSLFGSSRFGANPISSPFGGTSLTSTMTAPTGTTIKFNATAGTDTMMKNGVSQSINTRHQCITCMREYEMKSLEELRLEDYQANRKGPTNMFGTSSVSGSNLFGATSSAPNAFASTSSTGLFGQNKSTFGPLAPTTTSNSGLFGSFNNKSIFGTTNSFPSVQTQPQTSSIFGNPSATNTSLSQQSFFNSGTANTTASVKPLFGGQTQNQSLFGPTNTANTGLAQKPLFGNTNTSQFGSNNSTIFNTGNSGTLFSSSQPTLFSAGTTATTNTLSKPFISFTNQPSMSLNPTIGTSGATSSNLFGTGLTNFGNTGSMFSNNGIPFSLGTSQPFQTNSFQSTVGLQQMASASQHTSPEVLVTRFQAFPYGDSPHINIDVSISSNSKVKTKFTTDPKTLNQYKISGKSIDNKPKRIANTTGRVNTMLFDGLEEEDNADELKTAKDIFIPRRNIKKLVLKSKNTSQTIFDGMSENISRMPIVNTNERGVNLDETPIIDTTIQEFFNEDNRRRISNERSDSSLKAKMLSSPIFSPLSNESVVEQQIGDTLPSMSTATPKCGIILTRGDYYVIPTIEELDSLYDLSSDTCIVDSFTVGRHNYGSIFWEGPIDVKGINLDEIVHIRRKEVIVYPDDDAKPKVGEGLNRGAQITLHQVWPIDKTSHEVIRDNERLRSMKYEERIESATLKLGATFKEYRADTGSWVFTVRHFSKYGLLDDDEDEDEGQQQTNQTVAKTLTKQRDNKEMLAGFQSPFKENVDTIGINQFAIEDDLSNRMISFKDNTLNYLHLNEKDDLIEINEDESALNASLLQSSLNEVSEFDKMRNVLFDDFEEMSVALKKSKKASHLTKLNEKTKGLKPYYFSPIMPLSTNNRAISTKRRPLDLKADVFAAKNKIICDISSVCISSSPKITFFNSSTRFTLIKDGTVLICDLNLINFDNSDAERFNEQLQNNSNLILPSLNSIPPYIETKQFSRNSHNNTELEQLIEALYGSLSTNTPYAHHKERMFRIKDWLYSYNKKFALPSEIYALIIYFLSANELESAVNEAINANLPRLASLLACGCTINKDLMIAQLDSWKRCKADLYIDKNLLKIYVLLSGLITWNISDGTEINAINGLKWSQQLALILLYMTPNDASNDEIGLDLLKTSIAHMTVVPDDVEYHLLSGHTPWVAMSSSSNLLDSWFLHESLRCYHIIIDEHELSTNSDAVHCLLASQIRDIHWACFVALHIKNDVIRRSVVKEIICSNISELEHNEQTLKWLFHDLSLPKEYLFEANAIKAKSCFDHKSYAQNLIECQQWNVAHEVLMDYVFPDLIINEDYDSLNELISRLKPHSHLIANWFSSGAHIYDTYLQCLQNSNIENIKSFNVHQLKCSTKKHVLCQSEMTRKANIIYSELSGEFAYNTPIPDDYALIELKTNAKKLVKLLC